MNENLATWVKVNTWTVIYTWWKEEVSFLHGVTLGSMSASPGLALSLGVVDQHIMRWCFIFYFTLGIVFFLFLVGVLSCFLFIYFFVLRKTSGRVDR